MPPTLKRKLLQITIGLFWIALALVFMEGNRLIQHGFGIEDLALEDGAQIVSIVLFSWGVVSFLYAERKIIGRINLGLVSLILIAPLTGEVFIRGAIAVGIKAFREPSLYANYFSDDDYWKLHYRWTKSKEGDNPAGYKSDRVLGWSNEKTSENPLGTVTDRTDQPNFSEPAILFYGDSFVEGVTSPDEAIPQQLERILQGYRVYNFGVGGYGLDQMYLLFHETARSFSQPTIIFGMIPADLDRSILTVFTGPKPYFKLMSGELQLLGTPLNDPADEWYRKNPPRIKSYLFALIRQKLKLRRVGGYPNLLPDRIEEKKQVNAKILEKIAQETKRANLLPAFVLLYERHELLSEGWREQFIKAQLDRLSIPYIDTKVALLERSQKRPEILDEYYLEDGHLNKTGNVIIAEAIAKYFQP